MEPEPPLRILGLTGDIASGKSTVAGLLAQRGAIVMDADALVRELYSNPDFSGQVALLFGSDVLNGEGLVDREKLGPVVFADQTALRRLEALVHPAVADLRARKLDEIRNREPLPPAVVIEAVKLIESGQAQGCEEVWCVSANEENQTKRLMENRGLTEEQAQARLASQPPRSAKLAALLQFAPQTPFVLVVNDGTLEELEGVVEEQWCRFLAATR